MHPIAGKKTFVHYRNIRWFSEFFAEHYLDIMQISVMIVSTICSSLALYAVTFRWKEHHVVTYITNVTSI